MIEGWTRFKTQVRQYTSRAGISAALRNSGWLMADRTLRMGLGVVVGLWVARYLGPTNYGLINYVLSIFGLVGTVVYLGLDGVLGRFLVRYPSRTKDILGTAIVVRLVTGVIAFMALALWLYIGQSQLPLIGSLVLSAGFLIQPFNVVRYWFDAKLDSKQVVMAELLGVTIGSGIKIAGILYGAGINWFIGVSTVELAIGIAGFVWRYHRYGPGIQWRISPRVGKLVLQSGLPLILANSAVMVYMRIDQIMLNWISGPHEAGLYAAATRLSEMPSFIPALIAASVTPSIIKCKKGNPQLYLERIGRLMSLLTGLAYLLIVGTLCTAWWVVPLLLGGQYSGSTPILVVHVLGLVGIFQGAASGVFYINEKLTKVFAMNLVAVAIANIGLNIVLIPRFGGMGAAAATAVCQTVLPVILNGAIRRTWPLFRCQLMAFSLGGLRSKR
ncbi:flippase [bacterium]|nr:flippase [bacterium]